MTRYLASGYAQIVRIVGGSSGESKGKALSYISNGNFYRTEKFMMCLALVKQKGVKMKTGSEKVQEFLKTYEAECAVCAMLNHHWKLCFYKGKDTIKIDSPVKYCPECGKKL